MRCVVVVLLAALLLDAGPAFSGQRYFPPLAHDWDLEFDALVDSRYAAQLKALREKPLCCGSVARTYTLRFTWLRTFHHPVVLRLDKRANGTWTLTTKEASGKGGYKPGSLVFSSRRAVTAAQAASIVSYVGTGSAFWAMPTSDAVAVDPGELPEVLGMDGARWLVEVLDESRYHVVETWSPQSGIVRDIGLQLMQLSGREFGEVY